MNIPIYRAKKIDGGDYVEGYLDHSPSSGNIKEQYFISNYRWYDDIGYDSMQFDIDPATLSIYFPFFSIEGLFFGLDNGKGASLIEAKFKRDNSLFKGVAICDSNGHVFYDKNDDWVGIDKLKDIKVMDINL